MSDVDVFVIGGGPAGLAAAIAARREGLRVVVADGDRPPIALARYFPTLRERLPVGSEAGRERGAVTGNVTLRAVARGNVALIGDASDSVDAIAGEGICLSFRQTEVLAKALEVHVA